MKKLLFAAAIAAGAVTHAQATAVVWNLNNVSFDDGGTASGSFSYDADTHSLSAVAVSVTAGSNTHLPAYDYTKGIVRSSSQISFQNVAGDLRYMLFTFDSPLSNAGGTANIVTSGIASYDCTNCGYYRTVTAGSVSAGAVPEPASWALMLGGFSLVGGALRRKRAAVSFA